MKPFLTVIRGLLTVVVALIGLESASAAFHDGGAGSCVGCHNIHDARSTSGLLSGTDASSTCLFCHQKTGDAGPTDYHISTPAGEMPSGVPPKQLTPGGDFGWLKKSYTWIPGAALPQASSPGDRHGHNIVAAEFLYIADGTNTGAPGGSYPSDSLSCISCHDPHGKYRRSADGSVSTTSGPVTASGSYASSPEPAAEGSVGVYRLLGGKGYLPRSLGAGFLFVNDPPVAFSPDDYNRSEASTQTRVAYGQGMSEWCMNCHTDYSLTMHTVVSPGTGTSVAHPVGTSGIIGAAIADTYNSYIKSGALTGLQTSSYLSLVPFEEGTADALVLKSHARSDGSVLSGPGGTTAQVTCLTCHRAHASGWDYAARWNTKTDFIVFGGSYAPSLNPEYAQGRTEEEATRAYYDRPESVFALDQDSLCNKCHNGNY